MDSDKDKQIQNILDDLMTDDKEVTTFNRSNIFF